MQTTDSDTRTRRYQPRTAAVVMWNVELDAEIHHSIPSDLIDNLEIVELSAFADLVRYLESRSNVRLVLTSFSPDNLQALWEIQRLQTLYPNVVLMAVMEEHVRVSAFIDILHEYSLLVLDDAIALGGKNKSAASGQELNGEPTSRDVEAQLTPRQRDILGLLVRNKSDKQIAHMLNLTEKAVKNHCLAVFRKLGVSSREQAASRAQSIFRNQYYHRRNGAFGWLSILI